jgi:hypothetical protein
MNYKPSKRLVISPLIIAKSQMEYVPMYRAFNQGIKALRIEEMINKQIPIKIGDNIYHLLELKNTLKFKTIPGEKLFIRYYTKKEGEGIVMHPFEELGVFEEKIGRTL